MTEIRMAAFDEALARRADAVCGEAIELLLDSAPLITVDRHTYQVVVVAAPAGAGKSEFVCEVVQRAVERYRRSMAVVVVATPTNDQAYELVRRIATRNPTHEVAFVPAHGRNLPPATATLPNVHEVRASDANQYPIVVGTLDKLGDAHARGDLAPGFRFLLIDEAYQAHSAHYFGVAGLADRHLLVGDPGQLDPFTTMDDPDRWRGLPEDPTQTAVAVVCANHPAVPILRMPITRRLPPSAVPLVQAFYPCHPFSAWTLPGARSLALMPAVAHGRARILDRALDYAVTSGWAYLRLPDSPVLTADPATVEVLAQTASRLFDRSPRLTHERGAGSPAALLPQRVAVAVSHNDQKDHVRLALDDAGLAAVRVDTANKLQGLEFDVVLAWHPLAGLPQPDGFHLDPGRLCVMLSRHRHACIVVGRAGDADILESVPPPADAWLGYEGSPEVDGWFSHRVVFDQLSALAVDVR
jgi:hypothetical protein